MNLIEGEAPLRKKTQTLLFRVVLTLLDQLPQIGKIHGFIEVFHSFLDLPFRQLQCP